MVPSPSRYLPQHARTRARRMLTGGLATTMALLMACGGGDSDRSAQLFVQQLAADRPTKRILSVAPGVDAETFNPGRAAEGRQIRERLGLSDRPVIVCVSRLMPRKGQDSLIRALPAIRGRTGQDVALLIVGGGPYRKDLAGLVAAGRLEKDVVITGGVPWSELPAHFAAGDVFAMPCRTRQRGWDVEGLGIVYLEASATGLPVVSGDSGGAPDAVRDGETGFVVPGGDQDALVARASELLTDHDLASRMGLAGRQWVESSWGWDRSAERLRQMLDGGDPDV